MSLEHRAANAALYAFRPARLSADTFDVVRFEGTEGLCRPFSFEIQLVSTDASIDFQALIDAPATLVLRRGDEERAVHGVVATFVQRGHSADYVSYRAVLKPRLHRLSLSRRSRIYQDMSVVDILRDVVQGAGLSASDVRFALRDDYATREYCVQYQESDLAFLHRLLEFEGMYYFFEHAEGQDRLVVTDHKQAHERIPAPSTVPYHDGGGGMVERSPETVDVFQCREQMVPGTTQVTDYNYRTPDVLSSTAERDAAAPGTRSEYGGDIRSADRADRLATVRRQEEAARRRVLSGASNSPGLRSGFVFTLDHHFRDDLNADYLLTTVEHQGSQRSGLGLDAQQASSSEGEPAYRNTFTCIPASVQYRPPRKTPRPEVPGVLTATVERAGGAYAYIDDDGRYRAQLPFDERSDRADGTRTLPIRMAQPYTGADYGMHFPNHADTEMVLAFENGNIDRPVALGTVPNPANPSPTTADNKMENLLRSFGGNELLMDDTKRETRVRLRSAEDHELCLDDENDAIQLLSTDNHEVRLDDDSGRIEVTSKKGRTLVLDDKNEVVRLVSADGHFVRLSDADDMLTVSDADDRHVLTLDYENETMRLATEGDIELEADGAINMRSRSLSIETEEGAELSVGGDWSQAVKGNLSIETEADGTLEAARTLAVSGQDVTVEGAKSLSAEGGMTAELTGTQLDLVGSSVASVEGGVLKLNG
jgi:type VI secretion system secreted protein VgrG